MNTEQAIESIKIGMINYQTHEGWKFSQINHVALDVALAALRAQQERENPKPLTLEQFKERAGKPVWIAVEENEQGEPSCWAIVGSECEWGNGNGVELHSLIKDDGGAYEYYGTRWTAYDHEPKEAQGE